MDGTENTSAGVGFDSGAEFDRVSPSARVTHPTVIPRPNSDAITWVNRMSWGANAWAGTEWVPAEGGLRMLDPERWRPALRRSAGL